MIFYKLSLNLSPGAALWVKLPYHTCECTSVNVPWPSSLCKPKTFNGVINKLYNWCKLTVFIAVNRIMLYSQFLQCSLCSQSPILKKGNDKKYCWFWNPIFLCTVDLIRSLSKHDVDGSENVIWKYNFAFLQSFLNCSKSFCLKKNVF